MGILRRDRGRLVCPAPPTVYASYRFPPVRSASGAAAHHARPLQERVRSEVVGRIQHAKLSLRSFHRGPSLMKPHSPCSVASPNLPRRRFVQARAASGIYSVCLRSSGQVRPEQRLPRRAVQVLSGTEFDFATAERPAISRARRVCATTVNGSFPHPRRACVRAIP